MNKRTLIGISALVVALVLGFILFAPTGSAGKLNTFAQCLASKGAKMYGAAWCPHCQREKALFGASFKYVPYVECPDSPQVCIAAGVEGYPTWIYPDGRKFAGEQGLQRIAEQSGCPLVLDKP